MKKNYIHLVVTGHKDNTFTVDAFTQNRKPEFLETVSQIHFVLFMRKTESVDRSSRFQRAYIKHICSSATLCCFCGSF